MVIDKVLLDNLSAQAKASPRLRIAYDLRNTPEDNSQRMLNALEPGTIMPIHRHLASSETVVLLRGRICWHFYDDETETKQKANLN
jgi:cupin fold WbuC family metalloprotein